MISMNTRRKAGRSLNMTFADWICEIAETQVTFSRVKVVQGRWLVTNRELTVLRMPQEICEQTQKALITFET